MPPSLKVLAYHPQLLELFVQAAGKRFTMDKEEDGAPLTLRKARYIRQRMYNLKNALAAEGHPLASTATRVQIRVIPNKDNSELATFVAEPLDMDLVAGLRSAGLERSIPEAPPVEIDDPDDPDSDPSQILNL